MKITKIRFTKIQLQLTMALLACFLIGTMAKAQPANRFLSNNAVQTTFQAKQKQGPATNFPDRYNLPEKYRPAFENMPVWRLQLRVHTANKENAGTDDEVYTQLTSAASSLYYLDRAGDDRERNKVNTYEIVDPNIRTISDIKMLKLTIKGSDGWCVDRIELLVNGVSAPIFRKSISSGKWLDRGSGKTPSLYISGSEMRRYPAWKYTSANRAIWLPPSIIRRATLEAIVESYVGHMMNAEPDMRKLEFGKKYGRAYVEAKPAGGNKLHFDLDLVYDTTIDLETDVDFDLVVSCDNKQLNLRAQNVKAQVNVPLITRLIRIFKSDFAKMKLYAINFGSSGVPYCPSLRVTSAGDITIRP
ncbi:PLAT/LH2 domain-containing protein [Flavilitoribacter nigricans]|uniref:PLAT domain-containing protein n=1 Tax=Flavilitoribacter nigricans (strain ATCC 23147 / DSM 23189 / NBRC 102662 / NCIMB 1420 / SS-2) TaxID=1122177 RepID=A0A2D0N3W9_FLAN2|nr:PLAT/LH2 domain-containing protein [Flavilitoribacter nigricans]PHN03204.1 hypothetical protein CRP01_27815 [Flavilitoribacter nigricans DSM 23189 = NBRC 102662]